jgi:hypothetical protein
MPDNIETLEEQPRGAVPWSRKEIGGVEQFTPEEQEAIRQRMQGMDKLLKDETKAKYKIELFFGEARSTAKPTPGILSFWESGSRFHGGGDTKIYQCPGKSLRLSTCESFIPDSGNASAILFCPKCGTSWKGPDVIGERLARLSMQNWAHVLLRYFVLLEHNADMYLKHARDDIRTKAMIEQAKQKGGEVLAKVRNKRALTIYPLGRIVKDTSNGADLYGRFYAFLTA